MPAKSNEPIQRMNIWQRMMRDAAKDALAAEKALGLTPRSRGNTEGQAGIPKPPGRARPTRLKIVK